MKPALIVLVVVATAAVVAGDNWPGFPRSFNGEKSSFITKITRRKRDTTASLNDYMDRVLDQTVTFMQNNGLDPYELEEQFIYNLTFKLLLTYRTRLGIYDGEARNLTSIRRDGNATLSYTSDARTINLQATVAFDQIVIFYKYADQILNFGPRGTIKATLKQLTATLDVAVNLRTFNATLNDFKLNTAKSIKVGVTGLTFLGNIIVNLFVNFFTKLLTGPILSVVEKQLTNAFTQGINSTDAGTISITPS